MPASNLNTARYQWVLGALDSKGARTWAIARRLHLTTATARRRLGALEAAGKVRRNERYSAVNDIYWERVEADLGNSEPADASDVVAAPSPDAELGPGMNPNPVQDELEARSGGKP